MLSVRKAGKQASGQFTLVADVMVPVRSSAQPVSQKSASSGCPPMPLFEVSAVLAWRKWVENRVLPTSMTLVDIGEHSTAQKRAIFGVEIEEIGRAGGPWRGADILTRQRSSASLFLHVFLHDANFIRKSLIIREVEARGVEPLS
jgi:hypothetical protein